MAVENVVIAYTADVSDIKRQVTLIQRANKALAQNLGKDFTKGATVVRNELTKISTSAKQIKLPLGGTTNQVRQFATVLKGANGQLVTVKQSVAGAGKNLKVLNTTVTKGASGMRSFGANLKTLLGRALLTIPVWFALRQGIGSVFRTIKDGLGAIVEFDRALQKARRNLQGTSEEIERNFTILRKEVTALSIETGKSVEDITNAFQKFATVGFDFETSLSGANSATKLSILLFGDAQETATAFARTMRVLVDTTKDAKPASEQIAEAMALTSELWKTNAFELNEMNGALGRFAPVAKTANISMEESIKLTSALSTASLRNTRAGRLLGTSFARLVTKTDGLAKSLGVKVNPEVDRTFDVFLRVLDALEKTRGEAGKISPAFEKITKSIFGLRSSQAVKGLLALRENLQKVLDTKGDVGAFNEEFEGVNKSVFQLTAQFKNLNREIGKAFVIGLVGGEDFRDSLEDIVEIQKELITNAKVLGLAFKNSFAFLNFLVEKATLGGGDFAFNFIVNQQETEQKVKTLAKNTEAILSKTIKAIQGKLNKVELTEFLADIKKEIDIDSNDISIDLPKSTLIGIASDIETKLSQIPTIEPDIKVSIGDVKITTEEQNKLIQNLIDDQLKRLKLEGASESQLIKIEDQLRRQFDVNDNIVSQKQRQLDIERAITAEQKERLSFGKESVKLAEIAKTEGVETAVAIGGVLQGQRDFNTFIRQGGKNAEVLKNQFADFVKNKELEQFFKGEQVIGQPSLRGGQRIPINELPQRDFTPTRATSDFSLAKARLGLKDSTDRNNSALIQNTASIQSLINAYNTGVALRGTQAQRVNQALSQPTQKQLLQIDINVDGIERSFAGSPEAIQILANNISKEVAKAVEDKIVNDMSTNNNSPISKATDGRIDKF